MVVVSILPQAEFGRSNRIRSNNQFSVQNQLGDGHSISSTKSRRGKRALHEKLRQMRKAKSEKQNPNK